MLVFTAVFEVLAIERKIHCNQKPNFGVQKDLSSKLSTNI